MSTEFPELQVKVPPPPESVQHLQLESLLEQAAPLFISTHLLPPGQLLQVPGQLPLLLVQVVMPHS